VLVLEVESAIDVVVELPAGVVVVVLVEAGVVVVVDPVPIVVVVVVDGAGAVVVVTVVTMEAAISTSSKWMYPFAAKPCPSNRIVVVGDIQGPMSMVSACCFCEPARVSVMRVVQDVPPFAEMRTATLPDAWPWLRRLQENRKVASSAAPRSADRSTA
jgi:hypothetical protein